MFHLAAPLLVFGEVGRQDLATGWDPVVWTQDGRGIRTVEGLRVEDVRGPDAVDDADLVVLPSWPTDLPPTDEALARSIRAARARGSRIAGLCLGEVTKSMAERVAKLYDQLWDVRPSQADHRDKISVSRATAYACKRAWLPPLAWDDDTIDNPAAQPAG